MSKTKLLVADDSVTIQKVIRLALSNEGYEIRSVSNGTEASEQLALFRPDIIIVDASLPAKSAIDLKNEAAESGDLSSIRFVLMSSAFEDIDESLITNAGFDARLTKPFDPAHLRETLKELSNKKIEPSSTPEVSVSENFDFEEVETDTGKDHDQDEIQSLTEKTLGSSSENIPDFEWSLNEPAQIDAEMGEEEETSPRIDLDEEPGDISGIHELPPVHADEGEFDIEDLTGLEQHMQESTEVGLGRRAGAEAQPNVIPITTQQMEDIIREQLQETLRQMAKKVLPDIAERVIKEEIKKILSNPPPN